MNDNNEFNDDNVNNGNNDNMSSINDKNILMPSLYDDDYVRPPIDIIRDRLISNDNDFLYNNHDMNNHDINDDDMNDDKLYIDELNAAIEESILLHEKQIEIENEKQIEIENEKQIEIENSKKYKVELFQKLDIQLGYILLQKDEEIIFFNNCFKKARDDYITNNKEYIYLYKGHYDYLNNFLDDIYTKPKNKNRKTKIDDELYNLLINYMKYY